MKQDVYVTSPNSQDQLASTISKHLVLVAAIHFTTIIKTGVILCRIALESSAVFIGLFLPKAYLHLNSVIASTQALLGYSCECCALSSLLPRSNSCSSNKTTATVTFNTMDRLYSIIADSGKPSLPLGYDSLHGKPLSAILKNKIRRIRCFIIRVISQPPSHPVPRSTRIFHPLWFRSSRPSPSRPPTSSTKPNVSHLSDSA
ncbi:hypothetical protein BDW62DRAFT_117440 [Aspergillus aurantiobrunneus]